MSTIADDYPYRVTTALASGDIGPARRCQYPLCGQGGEMRYCGRRSQAGSSYCAEHRRRCLQQPTDSGEGQSGL